MDRIDAMRTYIRVVELGSFSAAAEELRIGQSTVSKWIAALEEELGTLLIARTTRTRRVTDAGKLFYERARTMIADFDEVTARLQSGQAEIRGRLRVSVPVVFGRLFVVEPAARFLAAHPELELDLVFSDRYVSLIDDGFDVAIRVGKPFDSTLRAKQLAVTGRHLVAAPSYLDRHLRPEHPSDLEQHSCLLHTGRNVGDTWTFQREDERIRVPVRGRFATNHSEAAMTMAMAGVGVALLATWLVDDALASGEVVELLPEWKTSRAPIQALMPPGRFVDPKTRAFVEHMAESLTELGSTP